jgi:hypothetical protein
MNTVREAERLCRRNWDIRVDRFAVYFGYSALVYPKPRCNVVMTITASDHPLYDRRICRR